MGTVSAKKITEALTKAKDIGLVEEPLTLGDCALVLRNLRPDEYNAIFQECKDLEEIEHLFGFQKAHLSRSIVEINGVDLREANFIEVEEEFVDAKTGETRTKTVKLERHAFIRREIVDSWSKETLHTAWRKFGDVLKLSEDKAKDGVKFILPEETPEERLRRVVDDLREALVDVPDPIVERVLEDAGLMRLSTAEELKRAMEKADQLAREQDPRYQGEGGGTPPAAPAAPPTAPAAPPPQAPPSAQARPTAAEEAMARRSPLNRQAVNVPVPAPTAPPNIQPAGPPPVIPPAHQIASDPRVAKRVRDIAEMEQGAGMEVPLPPPGDPAVKPPSPPEEIATLGIKGKEQVDPKQFSAIVEKPPSAGINPRFRPPQKMP